MKKSYFISGILLTAVILLASSCADRRKITRTDTFTSGVAEIAIDECLAPVIQQEIDVFEALYNDASIIPIYTNENDAYQLFMLDSIRLVIGTRELSDSERKIIEARKQRLRTVHLAVEGIALIINKDNKDSLISQNDIRKIMTGEIKSWKELNPKSDFDQITVAFDSPNSSTVRFIKDSICEGSPYGSNVKAISESRTQIDASKNTPNQDVIDYVAANPNALGIIGVGWISNPNDTTSLSFTNKITVMSVSREQNATLDNSYKPYAAFLALNRYPLRRNVYSIMSDVYGGITSGFVNFVGGEKGQRIIHKSGLFPATQPVRIVRINAE